MVILQDKGSSKSSPGVLSETPLRDPKTSQNLSGLLPLFLLPLSPSPMAFLPPSLPLFLPCFRRRLNCEVHTERLAKKGTVEAGVKRGACKRHIHRELEATRTHPFSRARKKGFSFFSCGVTPSRTVNKTQPLEVAFPLRERVDLRSQKEGDFGEENCLGKGGVDRAKKGKKDAQKKVGELE